MTGNVLKLLCGGVVSDCLPLGDQSIRLPTYAIKMLFLFFYQTRFQAKIHSILIEF